MKPHRLARILAGAMILTLFLGLMPSALAAPNDILSIDGKTGKIYLQADDDGYNYAEKYLYDVNFTYAQTDTLTNPTLAQVVTFLSTGRQEGFAPRVDMDAFINSALGKKTAQLWYAYMTWYDDPMAPGLIKYWADNGLVKEAFYDDAGVDDGISGNYYVYTPADAANSGEQYPLLVLFHGGGERAYQVETFGFCQLAASEGIILVAAENTGDYDSITAIIQKVEADYPVDPSRVYAAGSSAGGNAAMAYSVGHLTDIAACAVMDQPATLATRWFAASEEQIASMQQYTLPLVYVNGTADMYGLCGMQDREFWETSEGAEDQFISGWNSLMAAFGIEGKDLTAEQRIAYADNPANEAELYQGYPFDSVENIDETGTSAIYECTMDGVSTLRLYIVENRAHMPSGYDAQNIWNFISQYSRNLETGMSETLD